MKTIIKILIISFLFSSLFGCAESEPVHDSNSIENTEVDEAASEETTAEKSVVHSSDVAYTEEPDTSGEEITVYEETDPFGTPLWSGEESYFPLYAMIKEEDIYVYGVLDDGMILYQDGKGTYFEWPGLTHYRVTPQILYHDFDADEKKELAVILLVSHGSCLYKMDLHMLEIDDKDENDWGKPTYTEYVLLGDEVEDWFGDSITATLAKDKGSSSNWCVI